MEKFMKSNKRKNIFKGVFGVTVVAMLGVFLCMSSETDARFMGHSKDHPQYDRIEALKKKLETRYKIKIKKDNFKVKFHEGGSLKSIYTIGDFTPPGLNGPIKAREDVRNIANAFIEKEKKFLGLTNPAIKLKERKVKVVDVMTTKGLRISFAKIINGIEYFGGGVGFVLNSKGRIIRISTSLPPDTPEFNQAVARIKTDILSEAEMTKRAKEQIVELFHEAKDSIDYMQTQFGEKYIFDKSPYVIQPLLVGDYSIEVDAFTGKIFKVLMR